MGSQLGSPSRSLEQGRRDLLRRLEARRPEIELAALGKIKGISNPAPVEDPEYIEGLRAAVAAALDYGFASVEQAEHSSPPIPVVLRAQARLAARNGISLDTVLRRYFAGYTLLNDFVVEEAEKGRILRGASLKRLLRTQSALFDRLVSAIGEDYNNEATERLESNEERRTERVVKLLSGELPHSEELAYDFDVHHLGVIAIGPNAAEAIEALASEGDLRLLLIRRSEESVWAWLGARRPFDRAWLDGLSSRAQPPQVSLAAGEPARGLAGWRLTHQQARAALPIVLRSPEGIVRYGDVSLLASILQDDLLATSLHELYLAPLAMERDGGEAMRRTLRAYFDAERNVSSAAAALGVNRHTVANRLRTIEERFGRPLNACAAEVDTALQLEDLGYPLFPGGARTRA
jgi:hypothetical protein